MGEMEASFIYSPDQIGIFYAEKKYRTKVIYYIEDDLAVRLGIDWEIDIFLENRKSDGDVIVEGTKYIKNGHWEIDGGPYFKKRFQKRVEAMEYAKRKMKEIEDQYQLKILLKQ